MSIPLPPPVAYGATDLEDGRIYDAWYEPIEGCTVPLHTADQLHAHAAAVTAERDAEIANLKTVMVAAAEEIQAHWDAHCDAEGYGPANLMRRLEEGIPSQYGYTAGAFAALQERIKVLEEALWAADLAFAEHGILAVHATRMQVRAALGDKND